MEQVGPIFREYRLKRAFPLNQVAEGVVSTQFLRRFEKGQNDMTISKLTRLLQNMNVSLEEFMWEYYECQDIYTIEKMEEIIDTICIHKDEKLWAKWMKKTREPKLILSSFPEFNYFFRIILKIRGKNLFGRNYEIDIEPILYYLEKIETWGKHEYFLVIYTSIMMDIEMIKKIWPQAFSKRVKLPSVRRYSEDCYIHLAARVLTRGDVTLAKQLLADYQEWQPTEKILQNVGSLMVTRYIEGMILNEEGNVKGQEICDKILEFFENELGFDAYAKMLRERVVMKSSS